MAILHRFLLLKNLIILLVKLFDESYIFIVALGFQITIQVDNLLDSVGINECESGSSYCS